MCGFEKSVGMLLFGGGLVGEWKLLWGISMGSVGGGSFQNDLISPLAHIVPLYL